jgi:hypothetical protein
MYNIQCPQMPLGELEKIQIAAVFSQSVDDNGANVIGEGTYGCAHKPSMKCRDQTRRNKNEISKRLMQLNKNTSTYFADILRKLILRGF